MHSSLVKQRIHGFLQWVPDPLYIRLRYRQRLGFWPNFRDPKRFTEKLQWLKLHERNPLMTTLADKIAFKQAITEELGSESVIPLLAWGTAASSLNIRDLPNLPFVLKTNHDSGGTFIVQDPEKLDIGAAKKWLYARLKHRFYAANREWEYKNIEPRWFIEPLLSDSSGNSRLNDYKVHCFNGTPEFIQTIFDRESGANENWFDTDWAPKKIWYFSKERKNIERPAALGQMLSLAGKVAKPFPYVRVDFYLIDNHPYLGEMTFRPYGGFMKWRPDSADYFLGSFLDLNRVHRHGINRSLKKGFPGER